MIRAMLIAVMMIAFVQTSFAAGDEWGDKWPSNLFDQTDPEIVKEVKAHPDLVREAETYLVNCGMLQGDDQKTCPSNQVEFIRNYIGAFYNDHESIGNVMFSMTGQGKTTENDLDQAGIAANPIQGCAWELVLVHSGSAGASDVDALELPTWCGSLSDIDQQMAADREAVVLASIRAHVARGDTPTAILEAN
jgi:hypothetical protein